MLLALGAVDAVDQKPMFHSMFHCGSHATESGYAPDAFKSDKEAGYTEERAEQELADANQWLDPAIDALRISRRGATSARTVRLLRALDAMDYAAHAMAWAVKGRHSTPGFDEYNGLAYLDEREWQRAKLEQMTGRSFPPHSGFGLVLLNATGDHNEQATKATTDQEA
jgi:hypothetical protein